MSLLLLILCLALGIVFGVAGVAKLIDLPGTREAVKNFGVPNQFAGAVKLLLPMLEIAIAIGLLLPPATRWSSVAALSLLALFIVAIAVNIQRGRTHDCHCFGQLYSRPLGWSTLVRNLVFALGAGIIIWQSSRGDAGGANALGKSFGIGPAVVIGAEFVILAIIVAASILVQRRATRKKAASALGDKPWGLPIDSAAPAFELAGYQGGRKSLSDLLAPQKPLMLIFSSPKCGPCVAVFQEVGQWQRDHRDRLTVAIITTGNIKDNFVNVARNTLKTVLLQEEREVANAYDARATPTAVIVRPDGTIATHIAAGADEIRTLLSGVLNQEGHELSSGQTPLAEYSGKLQPESQA